MKVNLKLYGPFVNLLPADAVQNQASIEVADDQTAGGLLDAHNVPRESCHLMLVNGVYSPPANANDIALKDGDTVAVWPPVAGG